MTAFSLPYCGQMGVPSEPRLAVVISCYNYERFVGRAINSVVEQCRQNCELIVVDDGSTDGSWDTICRTGVSAFKIPNSGQRAACLFALEQTRAPYILFLDADDELKPGALDTITNLLTPKVAKLQFGLTRVNAEGHTVDNAFPPLETFRSREALAARVLKTGVYRTPPTSGNVFRRDLCQLLREADYDRAVDGIILFAAPLFGEVVSISDELGFYRIHERNDSGVGRLPELRTFERDIARFLSRMEHLRQILSARAPHAVLVDPRRTYYYRELKLFAQISSGRRPRLTALPQLLYRLAIDYFSLKQKLALAVFIILAALLPDAGRQKLLFYRLKCGKLPTRLLTGRLIKRSNKSRSASADPSTAGAQP